MKEVGPWHAWKILSNQTRPPIRVPGEHLGSNYRNIGSMTLVQKVIPGYLQRTVDNYSRAYLWLISHDLSHGVPPHVLNVLEIFIVKISEKLEMERGKSNKFYTKVYIVMAFGPKHV
jgi:hypothetical protein